MSIAPFARNPITLVLMISSIAFVISCAGPKAEILTSTPQEVSVEFPRNGDLGAATDLAEAECAKHGLIARFGVVKATATPSTRVAKYECVSPNVAAPPSDTEEATDTPAAADTQEPADAPTAADAEPAPAPEATPATP